MQIDEYHFGHMKVAGKDYDFDLIITPERILPGWWRKDGHSLHLEDLNSILDIAPAKLIIGRGAHGVMKVPEAIRMELTKHGFEVMTAKTADAVKKFNQLQESETSKPVIGAFHLTC